MYQSMDDYSTIDFEDIRTIHGRIRQPKPSPFTNNTTKSHLLTMEEAHHRKEIQSIIHHHRIDRGPADEGYLVFLFIFSLSSG